jgi:hypothetical protein
MLVDRMVTLAVLLGALGFVFVLVPAGAERIETGTLSPDALPIALGWSIAGLAALQLVNPLARPSPAAPRPAQTLRALGLILTTAACAWAIPRIGFLPATMILAFLVSMAMGERRPPVLAGATLGVPVCIWLVVTVGLDRALP